MTKSTCSVLNLHLEYPQSNSFKRILKPHCFLNRIRKNKKVVYSTTETLDNKLIVLSICDKPIKIIEHKCLHNRTAFSIRNTFAKSNKRQVKINLLVPYKIPMKETISPENHTIDTTNNSINKHSAFMTLVDASPIEKTVVRSELKEVVQRGVGTDKIQSKPLKASFSVLNFSADGDVKSEHNHRFLNRHCLNTFQSLHMRLIKRKSTKPVVTFPAVEKEEVKSIGNSSKLISRINLKLDCDISKNSTEKLARDRIFYKKKFNPIRLHNKRRTTLFKNKLFQRLNGNSIANIIYTH